MDAGLKPLSQQVVVITGASSGIGLATARLAAKRGAKVFLAARDGDALARICDELRANGATADFLVTDVGEEAAVDMLRSAVLARHGAIDTWVNVAGVGIIASLEHTGTADHRRLFDTNYWGVVHGSLAAARSFRERRASGAIINVGSSFSDMSVPTMGAYAASKFAVKAFSNALRVELAQEGLRVAVTLVKPSVIDSMFYDHAESTMDTVARIPPPAYAPSVVAEAIVDAAEHHRREIAVGAPAVFAATIGLVAPALVEKSLVLIRESVWKDDHAPVRGPSSVRGTPPEGNERSGRANARTFSVTATMQRHPWLIAGALFAAGLALGVRRPRRRGFFR